MLGWFYLIFKHCTKHAINSRPYKWQSSLFFMSLSGDYFWNVNMYKSIYDGILSMNDSHFFVWLLTNIF